MRSGSEAERRAAEGALEVVRRARRRLEWLEWVMILVVTGVALGGGALVALLIGEPSGWGFRRVWVVTSLLLFVVPLGISWPGLRRATRWSPKESTSDDDGLNDG